MHAGSSRDAGPREKASGSRFVWAKDCWKVALICNGLQGPVAMAAQFFPFSREKP